MFRVAIWVLVLGSALAARGVRVEPLPAVQGRPFWVRLDRPVPFVTYLGHRVPILAGRALVPVPAKAPAGSWRLWLADGTYIEVPLILGGYGYRRIRLKDKVAYLAPEVLRRARAQLESACSWKGGELPSRWSWPLRAPVSAPFGERRDYGDFFGYHTGLDLAAEAGTPVRAAARGRVVFAGELGPRGNAVVVYHGRGVCSVYAHLQTFGVRRGQEVERGARLGEVGSTGYSSGPHLHFELRVLGLPQDPAFFLEGR